MSRMRCPVCGSKAHIRTSRELTRKTREMYFLCQNRDCEHVFAGMLELTRSVGDSKLPPELRSGTLLSPAPKRKPAPAPDPNQMGLPGLPEPPEPTG